MAPPPVTGRQIQRAIIAHRYRRNFCIPNYTPRGWFECDVFELTGARSFREYEIKISRADWKADALKTRSVGPWAAREEVTKHLLLERADVRGPSQFWYACPTGLLRTDELPAWAGLIYFDGCHPTQVKPAPRLHRQVVSTAVRTHAMSVLYWRFHTLWLRRVNVGGSSEMSSS